MADNPNKKKEDGLRVSQQDHEVAYMKRKFPTASEEKIRRTIQQHGPMRSEIEKHLP